MRSPRLMLNALILVGLLTSAGLARGDDASAPPALDGKAIDQIVFVTLRDVINKGADIYNPPNSDYAGCWRIYEGGLMTVKPFLAHRPALQTSITNGLAAAYNEPSISQRAFILRKVVDEIRAEVKPGGTKAPAKTTDPKPAPAPVAKTLWDRLGGETNVRKVVDDFVASAGADKKVNFFRDGKYKLDEPGVAHLKKLIVELISEISGGPLQYSGRGMKEAHKGMGITDAEFDALAADLKTALEKNGAAADDVKLVLSVVGGMRKEIVEKKPEPAPAPTTTEPTKTLWERLGGETNVTKVVDDLISAAVVDPKVFFFRDEKFKPMPDEVAKLKKKIVEQISSISGGPFKYTGQPMKAAHKGMEITDAQFDAFAGHFRNALEKNGAAPADVKAVMDAVSKMRADIVEKK